LSYTVPDELEFFDKGFGYSNEYDHDEGQFSFLLNYENGIKLIFTHSPFGDCSVSAKIFVNDDLLVHIQKEGVSEIAFQSWSGEKVLRVYLGKEHHNYLVYFDPVPRIKYLEL